MRRLRSRPYTQQGIKRVPCCRCGHKRGYAQWNICADGNVPRALCAACDIELNELVMRWAFGSTREADLQAYRQKVASEL